MTLDDELSIIKGYIEANAQTPDYAILVVNASLAVVRNGPAVFVPMNINGAHRFKNGYVKVNDDKSISCIATTDTVGYYFLDFCCDAPIANDLLLSVAWYETDYSNEFDDFANAPAVNYTLRRTLIPMPRMLDGSYKGADIDYMSHWRYSTSNSSLLGLHQDKKYMLGLKVYCPEEVDSGGNPIPYTGTIDMSIRGLMVFGRGY